MEPIKIVIEEKPRPIKNNQSARISKKSGKPFIMMSKDRSQSLENARWKIRQQYRGKELDYRVDLSVTFIYTDARVPDTDNALNFTYDAIKGIVVPDDKPKYIGRTVLEDIIIDRSGAPARIEIVITKCKTTWKQIINAKT